MATAWQSTSGNRHFLSAAGGPRWGPILRHELRLLISWLLAWPRRNPKGGQAPATSNLDRHGACEASPSTWWS
jgi:hypothetical protein